MIPKMLCAFLAVTLIAGLTSCTANENITPNNSASVVTTTDSVKAAFSSQTAAITETASEITAEPKTNYSGFTLKDYCTEFDNIEFVEYTAYEPEETFDYTLEQEQAAIAAIKKSSYYTEVIEQAEKIFTYENGEFVPKPDYFYLNDDGTITLFMEAQGFPDYLVYNDGFDIEPKLNVAYKESLDGENDDILFIYTMPLPNSEFEWSGSQYFRVPVYVNSNGAAHILSEAADQSLYRIPTILNYFDGETHIIFNSGHTTGTAEANIYDIENGVPVLMYNGFSLDTEADGILVTEGSGEGKGKIVTSVMFREAESGSYCGIPAIDASDELTDLLLNAEPVLEAYPDIKEWYEKTGLKTLGGRYILIGNYAFTFEEGVIEEYNRFKWTSADDKITNYNILLP